MSVEEVDEVLIIDESLENCLAEKILELAKIRPIFRFVIQDMYITIESLEALLQFGSGKPYVVSSYFCFNFTSGRSKKMPFFELANTAVSSHFNSGSISMGS